MKLAYIAKISKIEPHGNADALEVAIVKNWRAIVKKGDFKEQEKIVFIETDTVLPDAPWATIYKAKSNRVKTIKLRGVFSQGIIEKLSTFNFSDLEEGLDVTETLGITKYEPPAPQDLQAKSSGLPFGIPITDETNYQSLDTIPYGEKVDVTLKVDGKSWTAYAVEKNGEWFTGICGRRLEYKLDATNDYTRFKNILPMLLEYAQKHHISIAIRGELYGGGIQALKNNPHARLPRGLSLFSVYLPDSNHYANKGDLFYINNVARDLGLPTVEKVETDVELTPELIKKYAQDLTTLNGAPFEGVVIQGRNFSFKVINATYDTKK